MSKNEGWICVRCRKSLAPWVKECDCIKQQYYSNNPTSIKPINCDHSPKIEFGSKPVNGIDIIC